MKVTDKDIKAMCERLSGMFGDSVNITAVYWYHPDHERLQKHDAKWQVFIYKTREHKEFSSWVELCAWADAKAGAVEEIEIEDAA